jgi:hypothetical protein
MTDNDFSLYEKGILYSIRAMEGIQVDISQSWLEKESSRSPGSSSGSSAPRGELFHLVI